MNDVMRTNELRIEALAIPDGKSIGLFDNAGREIGTAVVVDGRIHATITDRLMIQRLRHGHSDISMGYRVVIDTHPGVSKSETKI